MRPCPGQCRDEGRAAAQSKQHAASQISARDRDIARRAQGIETTREQQHPNRRLQQFGWHTARRPCPCPGSRQCCKAERPRIPPDDRTAARIHRDGNRAARQIAEQRCRNGSLDVDSQRQSQDRHKQHAADTRGADRNTQDNGSDSRSEQRCHDKWRNRRSTV